ncbi:MAG: hypothetical protein IJ296_00995 [Bacteroidales bacterium]|nr:hypothetical protein [Bacteroidales bacterium]
MKKLFALIILSLAIVACEKEDGPIPPVYKYYPEPENLAVNEVALCDSIVVGNTEFTQEEVYQMLRCGEDEAWYMYEIVFDKLKSERYNYEYDEYGKKVFKKLVKKGWAGNFTATVGYSRLSIVGFYDNNKYVCYIPNRYEGWSNNVYASDNQGCQSSERSYRVEDGNLICGTIPGLVTSLEPVPLKLVSVEEDRIIFDREIYKLNSNELHSATRYVAYKLKYKDLASLPVDDSRLQF